MARHTDPLTRAAVRGWITEERADHADVKFGPDTNRAMMVAAMEAEGYAPTWSGFVGNYLKRAEILGLEHPAGRQALGKALVTLLDCLETAVEVHGPMPEAGHPSGEIVLPGAAA